MIQEFIHFLLRSIRVDDFRKLMDVRAHSRTRWTIYNKNNNNNVLSCRRTREHAVATDSTM